MTDHQQRVNDLLKRATIEFDRYLKNEVPLFVSLGDMALERTMVDIEHDMKTHSSIEYKVHKHLYPGFRRDNISFLTGKFYLHVQAEPSMGYVMIGGIRCLDPQPGAISYIEIPGAPSYVEELQKRLSDCRVSFTECEHDNGFLTVRKGGPDLSN
jgi:hypothetical protein